jgi:hypothetical protein
MGADYSAYAIIGVRVPVERLYKERRVRNCAHPLPDSAAFCPACGKAAYRIDAEPIYDDKVMIGSLSIVFGTDRVLADYGMADIRQKEAIGLYSVLVCYY